jgi:integrase
MPVEVGQRRSPFKGTAAEVVSKLLGHTSIKTTEKHYAPWVKSRQVKLEEAVKMTWL